MDILQLMAQDMRRQFYVQSRKRDRRQFIINMGIQEMLRLNLARQCAMQARTHFLIRELKT